MLRRKSPLALVTVAIVITAMITVGVTYAVLQVIINTTPLSAFATIAAPSPNLFVCETSDVACATTPTTSLNFGTLVQGQEGEVSFKVKNTSSFVDVFVDFSILPNLGPNSAATNLNINPIKPLELTGSVSGLGEFRMDGFTGATPGDPTVALTPGQTREMRVFFFPEAALPPGDVSFTVNVNEVDFTD